MKVLAVAGVSLRRFVRDRSNLFFVLVLPLVIVLLIGVQFGGDDALAVGVAGSEGDVSASVVELLEADDDLEVHRWDDEGSMVEAVERGRLVAGVVLPPGLDEAVAAGDVPKVGFVASADTRGPQLRPVVDDAVARAAASSVAVRAAVERGADPAEATGAAAELEAATAPVVVRTVTTGDELFEGDVYDVGAPSQLVLFMLLTGLTGAANLIQVRKLGISARMRSTPTSVGTIIAGEALGRFAIVVFQGLYIMVATAVLFDMGWGDPVGAAAVLVVFGAVGAAAAMLAGTLFDSEDMAAIVGVVVALSLAAVGGAMVPLEVFSDTMRSVARVTPHYWALEAFSELTRHEGGPGDIAGSLGVLCLFALGLGAVAVLQLRRALVRAA